MVIHQPDGVLPTNTTQARRRWPRNEWTVVSTWKKPLLVLVQLSLYHQTQHELPVTEVSYAFLPSQRLSLCMLRLAINCFICCTVLRFLFTGRNRIPRRILCAHPFLSVIGALQRHRVSCRRLLVLSDALARSVTSVHVLGYGTYSGFSTSTSPV